MCYWYLYEGSHLQIVLAQPDSFSCLSDTEKELLVSLLPKDAEGRTLHMQNSGTPEGAVDARFLRSDVDFLNGVSRFQEDIREGRLDDEWLRQGVVAHEERKAGNFDDFKDNEYESFWGHKQKLSHDVTAGFTAKTKFDALCAEGVIQVGDVFCYARKFAATGTHGEVLIEKHVKVNSLMHNTVHLLNDIHSLSKSTTIVEPRFSACLQGSINTPVRRGLISTPLLSMVWKLWVGS